MERFGGEAGVRGPSAGPPRKARANITRIILRAHWPVGGRKTELYWPAGAAAPLSVVPFQTT